MSVKFLLIRLIISNASDTCTDCIQLRIEFDNKVYSVCFSTKNYMVFLLTFNPFFVFLYEDKYLFFVRMDKSHLL